MKLVAFKEVVDALRALGIGKGDIVHVQSDLRSIGPTEAPLTREGQCGFYLQALQTVVGEGGTITCCTAFEDYARYGTPFNLEASPSRTDMLSEFIRTRKGAIRSMHPIVSITGIGPLAQNICGGTHFNGFGYNSPWGRLHQADAKILNLGIPSNTEGGMTFLHYCEAMYGVPYQYIKLYTIPVSVAGKIVEKPFSMHVRYLDFAIENSVNDIKSRFLKEGLAKEKKTGRSSSLCISAKTAFSAMMKYLNEDLYIYLKTKPTFRDGVQPTDGPTGEMRKMHDKSST